MKPLGAKPGWRPYGKYLLLASAAGLVILAALAWYVTTDAFQAMVRRRFVAEVERVTGGRVELGSIHSIPLRLEVEVRNLTIHGREQPSDIPYAHVDRLLAQIKLRSALGGELSFHSVVLERPRLHLLIYADGSTNQPVPERKSLAIGIQLERLFRFSVNRLEVRQGELVWNDRTIPLDFLAQDMSASLDYSLLRRRYEGSLAMGKINIRFEDYLPSTWTAQVHFELGHNHLLINSLKAASGRSHLEVSGRVVDFRRPVITGQYDLKLDLAEASATTRLADIRHGMLALTGRGSWSRAAFSADGKWELVDFDWGGDCRKLQTSSFAGQFSLRPDELELRDIEGRLLGGSVTGEAQVVNWQSSLPWSLGKTDVERGILRLRMKNLSAEAMAAACASSARPFERMQLVGYTSGSVDAHWKGSPRNTEAEITLDVAPPAHVLATQLPVHAHGHAIYRFSSGELEVSEFNADTLASQAHASGTFSARAALKVSLTTTNLGEWDRVLAALGYEEPPLPFAIRGRATFTGAATGRLSEIDFTGRLQSQDVELALPGNRGNPPRKIRWDSLSTSLELSPHGFAAHRGTLRRGATLLRFDLSGGLDQRKFTDHSPFVASVEIQNAEAEEIVALAGYSYPVSGRLDLSLHASGTRASPTGGGWFHLASATVAGTPLENVQSSFTFQARQLLLDEIRLAYEQGQVQGSGTYDFDRHGFQLNFAGSNFDLAHVPWLRSSKTAIAGRLDFVAQASGTFEQPNINSQIRLRDVTVGEEPLGEYTIDAVSQGADLRVRGQSQFKTGQLDIAGDIDLREDWPAKIDFQFNHLDVHPILVAYLPGAVIGPTPIAGDLEMRGPLRNRSQLELAGHISDALVHLGPIQLRNNGPIQLMVSGQVLKFQRFRMMSEDTDLEVEGSVSFGRASPLDLHAEGDADLALLQALNPSFHSSGAVALDVHAQGSREQPIIDGRARIRNGLIQYGDLPSALSDLNGSLVFHEDRLQIEALTGQAGGGSVRLGGYATWYQRQLNFDLTLNAEDVRLRYPPGVSSMTTANLRWTGTPTGSTLSGEATISKLSVIPGFNFGTYLLRSTQAPAITQTNPLLTRIRMDVHLVTTPDLEMQTAALNLSGNADLNLRGTAAKPVLLGRADVLEGQVVFNGTKYRMERGDITFTNPVTTTPVLDLQASTQVREYDIMINLNGPFDKLNLSYHSEPPLPTADIISLLAPVGTTQAQFGQVQQQAGSSPFVQQASSEVLAEAVNSALSNRSQHLFGISHIKIDPQGLNEETSPTQTSQLPAVTIEQQVKNNVTLTYTTNVAQTSQQIIQGEYNITHNLSVVGIRDFNGVVSFEVRIRQNKR